MYLYVAFIKCYLFYEPGLGLANQALLASHSYTAANRATKILPTVYCFQMDWHLYLQ